MRIMVAVLFAAILVFVIAIVSAPPSHADSGIIGTWTTVIPDNAGGQRVFLQVREDSSYTMYSAVYGSAGHFVITPPDRWRLIATTVNYADQGTFRLPDPNKLLLTGALGTGEWTRVTQWPMFPEATVLGQRVPSGVHNLVVASVLSAREEWQPDAIPVMLRVTPEPSSGETAYFQITVTLYAPSADAGQQILLGPYSREVRDIPTGQLAKDSIAADFVDLPKAIEIAHDDGMNEPFKQALMLNWSKAGSVWQIHSTSKIYQVTSSGEALHGDIDGYIEQYNAQWNSAIAGLQARFGQAELPKCPMRHGSFWGYGIPMQPCELVGTGQDLCAQLTHGLLSLHWKNGRCVDTMPVNCAQMPGCW
jgi:hypothetical protein